MPGMLIASAEQAVYRKVCIELLRELFDTLPKKDRDILGKTCGVFGYSEASLKEIGMYHMMKESAVEKAKNRAVEKLRAAYPGSRLQIWKVIHRMMRRPVPPPTDDSELRRNFPQYVRALAEVTEILNQHDTVTQIYRVTGKDKLHVHAVAASAEEMEAFLHTVIDALPGVVSCSCNMILSRIKDIKGLRL